jgi:hypothetical protein
VWTEVGKQSKTKYHLGITTDADATKHAQSRLNKIMEERNRIAHPTGQTNFPGPDEVLEATGFLKMLAEVIVEILRVYMVKFNINRISV